MALVEMSSRVALPELQLLPEMGTLSNSCCLQGFPAFSSTCIIFVHFVFPCHACGVICVTAVVDLIYITNFGFLLSDL